MRVARHAGACSYGAVSVLACFDGMVGLTGCDLRAIREASLINFAHLKQMVLLGIV